MDGGECLQRTVPVLLSWYMVPAQLAAYVPGGSPLFFAVVDMKKPCTSNRGSILR